MSQNISRFQLAWFFLCGVLLWCAAAAGMIVLVEWLKITNELEMTTAMQEARYNVLGRVGFNNVFVLKQDE